MQSTKSLLAISTDRYTLRRRKQVAAGWARLLDRHPQGMLHCIAYLESTPLMRKGRTKKLRGRFAGLLQYDVDEGDRIWYWVDTQAKVVTIEYAGKHPKSTE